MQWWITGSPDLQELRAFLHEIVSSPWIAMLGFVGQMFVDKNKNHIPDILEKDIPPPPPHNKYIAERTRNNDTR